MSEILIYQQENCSQVSVRMDGETIWLTQKQLADLLVAEYEPKQMQAMIRLIENMLAGRAQR